MSFFRNKKDTKPKKKPYHPDDYIASHGHVLKHVVLTTVLMEYMKQYSTIKKGIRFVDCMAGQGIYDLNQHSNTVAYTDYGILNIMIQMEQDIENTPPAIIQYIQCIQKLSGCTASSNLDVYPGSPILVQHILQQQNEGQVPWEHRLMNDHDEEIQWLNTSSSNTIVRSNLNAFDTEKSMEFMIPYTNNDQDTLHPIIYIDPDYINDSDYSNTKQLITNILQDQCSYATIIVVIPIIHNHPYRYTYVQSLKDIAKKYASIGRYYCNTILCPISNAASVTSSKDQLYIGDGILVINPPTSDIDTVLDDHCIHWLANVCNQGKDEYTIEQIMKKKKKT